MAGTTSKKQQALQMLAGGSSAGENFLDIAARAIALGIDCEWGGIAIQERSDDGISVRVLAISNQDGSQSLPSFTFDAAGTPCGKLHDPSSGLCTLFVPSGAKEEFPASQVLNDLNVEAYWGESFSDTNQQVGHVFGLHPAPLEHTEQREDFFRLVAQRVGSELMRQHAQSQLDTANQIIRNSQDLIHILDEKLNFTFASHAFAKLLGRSDSQFAGSPAESFFDKETFESVMLPLYRRVLANETIKTMHTMDTSDGTRRWFSTHLIPMQSFDRLHILAISRDITPQTRSWESHFELATSKNAISGNVLAVTETVVITIQKRLSADITAAIAFEVENNDSRVTIENIAIREGYSGNLLPSDNRALLRPLLAGETIVLNGEDEEPAPFTLNGKRPPSLIAVPISNGREIAGALVAANETAADWTYLEQLGIQQQADVISQVKANQNRIKLEERIALSNKLESLGALAGGMAHDINNLLVPILYGIEIAIFSGNLLPQVEESLTLAKKATLNAADFCSQFLAIGNDVTPTAMPVNAAQLIEEVLDLQSEFLRLNSAEVHFNRPFSKLEFAGVATLLRQALTNLIRNAVEAGDGQKRTIMIEVSRVPALPDDVWQAGSCDPSKPFVLISVSDDGCGMDSETQRAAMEPFFSTKPKGKGLGLSVVQSAIKAHKGGLRVESNPNEGTRFEVFLPERSEPKAPNEQQALNLNLSVLLVDDNPIVRGSLTRVLEDAGHTAFAVAGGVEAIQLLESGQTIDAAVIDFHMPGMDGPATLRKIRESIPAIPAIGISGYASFWPSHEITILQKPFQNQELLDRLDKAVTTSRMESPLGQG